MSSITNKRRGWRTLLAIATGTALTMGGTAVAHATPVPDEGPIEGGTTVTLPVPSGGGGFNQLSTGWYSSFLIAEDGKAYAFGSNYYGELGLGTNADTLIPTIIPGPEGVEFSQIDGGHYHTVTLGDDGNAYSTGRGNFGQLGNSANADSNLLVPVAMPSGVRFTQVSAGEDFSLAISNGGIAYAWGANWYGRLGNGTNAHSNTPVPVSSPAGITFARVSAGADHALALGSDGKAYAWGGNWDGELGTGTGAESAVPVPVFMPPGVTFTDVVAGDGFSLALGNDGKAYAWGNNGDGQLGNGTNVDSNVPTPVMLPSGVTFTQVSGLEHFATALGSDGKTYAWGHNSDGELGAGTATDSNVPVAVTLPGGAAFDQVSSGYFHSLALSNPCSVYAWGAGDYGMLGNGTTTKSSTPAKVSTPVVDITGVTFDGVAGTGLVLNEDCTMTIHTPAHSAGPVDVVVNWSFDGVEQTPVTYSSGFTYRGPVLPPSISDPADQTVKPGDQAVFTVITIGNDVTVTWEVSTDGGLTWQPILQDPAARISNDGLTLTIAADKAHDGYLYRATATNSAGSDISASAKLTVEKTVGSETPGGAETPKDSLASTGGAGYLPIAMCGALLLLLGISLIQTRRRLSSGRML